MFIEVGNRHLVENRIQESINSYTKAINTLQIELPLRVAIADNYLLRKSKSEGGGGGIGGGANGSKHTAFKKKIRSSCSNPEQKLISTASLLVIVLNSLSKAEEVNNNYSRMLECLRMSNWIASVFNVDYTYPELFASIHSATEQLTLSKASSMSNIILPRVNQPPSPPPSSTANKCMRNRRSERY